MFCIEVNEMNSLRKVVFLFTIPGETVCECMCVPIPCLYVLTGSGRQLSVFAGLKASF